MKTGKTSFKKIISSLLCCSLVLELGWSLNGLDLNAADIGSGVITVIGTTVTLSTQGTMSADFTVTADGSGYKITCDNPYDAASSEKTISNIAILQCSNEGNVNIETDLRSALVLNSEYSSLVIKSGYTFNCTGLSGTKGIVYNYGTWSLPAFSSAATGDSTFRIFNYGTISASTIDISDTTLLTHDGGSQYIATTSFTKGSDNYDGLVVAGSSSTSIVSSGGSFKLKLGSDVQDLTGAVNDTAGNLVLPTLVVGLDTSGLPGFSGTPLYYGQIYDFSRGITTDPSGYASQGHIEYANQSSDSFSTAQPTYPGYYDVKAVVPDVTGYNGSSSERASFRIQYLPYTELFSDDNAYVEVSGFVNGKYVPDKLTLTAPSGMEIGLPSLPGFSRYSSSVSLSKDDLYLDGNLNADLGISFRRTSDNATTDERSLSRVVTGLSEYVFDTDTPSFDSRVVNAEGDFREVSIEDGGNIVGNEIRIIVSDENLASVKVEDRTDRTMDDLSSSISNGSCVITISGIIGESHTYNITAIDMADKMVTASFTLYHEPVDPTLTVTLPETIYVGDSYSPVITTDSDGIKTVNYTYTDQDLITSVPPTAAGNYGIIVRVSGTDYYNEASYSDSFTIYKNPGSASVSAEDITIGGTVSPVLTTTSDGRNDAVFEYKVLGAADSAYTRTVPTAAGTYTVRATVPETDSYLSISCTADFKINKKVAEASVSVADITVGGTVRPVLTTSSDGKGDAVFEYKAAGAPDSAYSSSVPSAAGTYMVRATVPETAVYQSVTASGTFKIDLNEATLDLTVDDIFYGQKPDPSFSTNSNGAVVIMYKSSDAPDSAYTTVAPTDVGSYIARATVRETGTFARTSVTSGFKISYLGAPKTAYTLSGTEGNNGFFTSDVELMAPDGYLISDSLDGEYAESIPYSGDLNAIYLKRIDDGALTSSIAIGETDRPKIDKDAPVFNTSSGSIDNGSVVYVSKLDVIANDPNLRSLTVNGKPVDLSSAGNILSLDPGYGFVEYTIVAEDEAGNITTFKFILMAEWRREGILPPDVVLPLYVEETYKLDTGTWTVNDDTTVYNGGMPVYVNEDGDYTFTKVS